MKGAKSSLNPYAAVYIPLPRRGATDEIKGYNLAADSSKSGHEAFWMGPQPGNATHNQYQKGLQSYTVHNTASEDSKLKGHSAYGSYGSSSLYPNEAAEKQTLDDESDMDLAYLQMTFPGVSDESLSDVYLANKGDLEATVDMLNQLELYTVDSSENLPETLDIGDVSESGLTGQKLKNMSVEVGGSSSGSRPLTT